jgi:ABC-type dipeptide/oligopeptide/nickel transport system permease subunit
MLFRNCPKCGALISNYEEMKSDETVQFGCGCSFVICGIILYIIFGTAGGDEWISSFSSSWVKWLITIPAFLIAIAISLLLGFGLIFLFNILFNKDK